MFTELTGTGGMLYRAAMAGFKGYARLLGATGRVCGLERVPRHGGFLLVTNHISYLDPLCVGLVCLAAERQVRILAKQSLFHAPVLGQILSSMGHIPVPRSASSLVAARTAIRALQDGNPVAIFPEATISRSWTIQDFEPGALRIAIAARVPIIPMLIWGPHRLLTVDGHIHATRGVEIRLQVGDPFTAHLELDGAHARRQAARYTTRLRHRMSGELREIQSRYARRAAGSAGAWWMPADLGGTAPSPETARRIDLSHMRVEGGMRPRRRPHLAR